MEKKSVIFKSYLVVVIGLMIMGAGCAFLIISEMGNDTLGVMVSGFAKTFGTSYGTMNNIISAVIFLVMLIFYRKRVTLATVFSVFVLGWTVDPVCALLSGITVPDFVLKFVYPIVGIVIVCYGISFYLCVDMGASINDNLILFICDKTDKPYSFGCYLVYAIYVALGVVTGGVWGYATILELVVSGKLIDFFLKITGRTVAVWAKK